QPGGHQPGHLVARLRAGDHGMTPRAGSRRAAHRTPLGHDDKGVSSVVSAVLLFGLFTTAFTVWSFTTLPKWEADNEQAHHRQVVEAMAGLEAGLSGLSGRNDPGPYTGVVPLGTPAVPLLQSNQVGA